MIMTTIMYFFTATLRNILFKMNTHLSKYNTRFCALIYYWVSGGIEDLGLENSFFIFTSAKSKISSATYNYNKIQSLHSISETQTNQKNVTTTKYILLHNYPLSVLGSKFDYKTTC